VRPGSRNRRGARPPGPAGLLVNELTVKGILKSPQGGFLALAQAPDTRPYNIHAGDKVFDGVVGPTRTSM